MWTASAEPRPAPNGHAARPAGRGVAPTWQTAPASPEPSLGQLFGDLSREMGDLVRQEVRLATTEMTHKVSGLGRDVALVAAGGVVAYAGLLAVVAALALLLALVIPTWLATLVVGLVVIGIGYALARRGLDGLKRLDLAPRATLQSVQEDIAWAKREVA